MVVEIFRIKILDFWWILEWPARWGGRLGGALPERRGQHGEARRTDGRESRHSLPPHLATQDAGDLQQ